MLIRSLGENDRLLFCLYYANSREFYLKNVNLLKKRTQEELILIQAID